MNDYKLFMYLGTGLICILSLITSLLFLYYGLRLASMYSTEWYTSDNKDKKFIHDRVKIEISIKLLFLNYFNILLDFI